MVKAIGVLGSRAAYRALALVLAFGAAAYVVPVLPFVPHSAADLKFSVIDSVGEPLVCTGWGMPNPPFNPYGEFPRIASDLPTYSAILRREHLPPMILSNSQIVLVYGDWLKLNAVQLTWDGGEYDFAMFPGPRASGVMRNEMAGKVDRFGHVYDVHQTSDIGGCPICLSPDSLIATPTGPMAVSKIEVGMHVWSVDGDGRRVDAVVSQTARRLAAPGSDLIRVVLGDGREVVASPPHQLADGRRVGGLDVGDQIDGAVISRIETVDDSFGFTFDVLPSGATGEYWVNGILMRSTLSAG